MDRNKEIPQVPFISWDNDIKPQRIIANEKYRNIGDMLVTQSENIRRALHFCGTDEAMINGTTSDYEKFRALTEALPLMPGHREEMVIHGILKKVFGITGLPSSDREGCEQIWRYCNHIIDQDHLTPLSLAKVLGIGTIFLRFSPSDDIPSPEKSSVSLYPVFDLGDLCSEVILRDLITKCGNFRTIDDLIHGLGEKWNGFLSKNGKAARIMLSDYHYERNSRKKELDGILYKIQSEIALTRNERNQFSTALIIEVAASARKSNLCLILQTSKTDSSEIIKLYDYLKLNLSVPETVLLSSRPENDSDFISRFGFRTDKGLPGIVPAVSDPSEAAYRFPLGVLLHRAEEIFDITDFGRFSETISPDIMNIIHKNGIKRFGTE